MKFEKILTIAIGEENLDPNFWKKIDDLAEKKFSLAKDSQEIKTQLADCDCLLVNPFTFKVEKDIIDAAPKLKYIGALATAYGKIDVDYAKIREL